MRFSPLKKFSLMGKDGGSRSWTPLCKPTDLAIEVITGGVRLTWTPCLNAETELYVSIDGGAYSLIATLGLTVGTYDYACESDGFDYAFKARSKYDETILNAPNNIVLSEIAGGIRITGDVNNTEAEYIEIYDDTASAGYDLLTTLTVSGATFTYDYSVAGGTNVKIKARAKTHTLPVYSDYSSVSEIDTTSIPSYDNLGGKGNRSSIIDVTSTFLWHKNATAVPPGHLVNGVTAPGDWCGPAVNANLAGLYINFDFKTGARKIITESKFYNSANSNLGVWKWQGSNEESATPDAGGFTDIGGTFTLIGGGSPFIQTITTLSANATGYRHYRLLGVSGSTTDNQCMLQEFEFKTS